MLIHKRCKYVLLPRDSAVHRVRIQFELIAGAGILGMAECQQAETTIIVNCVKSAAKSNVEFRVGDSWGHNEQI